MEVRESDELMILEVCCGSPIKKFSIGRINGELDDIQEDMRDIVDSKSEIAVGRFLEMNQMKSWVSPA